MAQVARAVSLSAPSRRARTLQRLRVLVAAVEGGDVSRRGLRELLVSVEEYLRVPSRERVWFVLAVLGAKLPLAEEVVDATRVAVLDGGLAAVRVAVSGRAALRWVPVLTRRDVEVVSGGVLVDVDHTAKVRFATGIQRVVRETVKRWARDHDPVLVGWTPDRTGLRRLSADEIDTALTGTPHDPPPRSRLRLRRDPIGVVVPLGGVQLLPELSLERETMLRLAALGEFSSTECGVIGYDTVPLSSAETTDVMTSGGFANNLSAVKHADRVATISETAAVEYRGWRDMLAGSGLRGPDIRAVRLADEPTSLESPPDTAERFVEEVLDHRALPFVLVVGSHEPRKNHLAVLTAAEVLWREGLRFQLLFVGGNAWSSGLFTAKLAELRDAGRPVMALAALDDELLWFAYRHARLTAFPSLTEGFGLPIVESLSVGTPVVTSRHGSMREIAVGGGAIMVDPRDDDDVARGMRILLTDDLEHERLSREARARGVRRWDDYAADTWEYLTRG